MAGLQCELDSVVYIWNECMHIAERSWVLIRIKCSRRDLLELYHDPSCLIGEVPEMDGGK